MTEITKKATRIVFGNKEKKQFPDHEGLEREKPSSAIEGSTQPLGSETNRSRNKFSEAAPPMPGAKQTLNNRLQRVGSVRRGVTLAAPRKEEVDGNMENKTFTQFVTEAKRGRPRKLRPGEKADTEHLQDQLSKLTHPNHVIVHFADGTKHQIPRGHANKALQKLASLKPEHRAAHVEHMHSSHENFYKTLAGHPIPSKKKTITLAGPKLRKEEAEVEEDYDPEAATWSKKFADNARFAKSQSKADHLYARINPEYKKEKEKEAKSYTKKSKDAAKKAVTGMDEEAEHDDDGWYAHKEMHGKDAVSRENWKKGIRKKPAVKKEEVEQIDELSIYKMQAVSKEASRRNKDYSDPKGIKHQVYGTEVADDKIVKKAGKYDPSTATKIVDKIKDKLQGMSMKKKMAEEIEQIDEVGDTPAGKKALGLVAARRMHDTREYARRSGADDAEGRYNQRRDNTNKANKAEGKVRNALRRLSDTEYYKKGKFKKEEAEHIDESLKDARKHRAAANEVGHKHPDFKKHMAAFHTAMANHASKGNLDGGKMADEHRAAAKQYAKEEVETDEKKKKDHHKLLQKFRHRIDEIKAIKGTHATKLHAAKVIHPDKVGYAGKQTKPKVQNLRREDYAPLETGEKQDHVDQKTVDAKSRKQGAEKPKKPKMEMTKEAWALYDTLSDKNKAIFEKMDAAERDALVDKYISGKR